MADQNTIVLFNDFVHYLSKKYRAYIEYNDMTQFVLVSAPVFREWFINIHLCLRTLTEYREMLLVMYG